MERKHPNKRFDNSLLKKYFTDYACKDKAQRNLIEIHNEESLPNKQQNKSTTFEAGDCISSRALHGSFQPSKGRKVSFANDVTDTDEFNPSLGARNASKVNLEVNHLRVNKTMDVDTPLKRMLCTGQKVALKGEKSDKTCCVDTNKHVSTRRNQDDTHTVALNKLYSSLKRLKSRHEAHIQEDVHVKCSSFPFNSRKSFGNNWMTNSSANEEEIFILLGGKSKPVRFDVNPENINLIERQFGMNLKVKTVNSVLDSEDLELLKRFREKYRCHGNGNESPFLPWARHAVCRGKRAKGAQAEEKSWNIPSATYEIEEEDRGRKLSIHVYLPNVLPGETSTSST